MGRLQFLKRDIGRNFLTPAEIHQVRKFHAVVFRITEGLDGAVCKGEGVIRYDKIHVNPDGATKTATGITCPHGAVKREKIGQRSVIFDIAMRTGQTVAEGIVSIRPQPDIQSPGAEAEGQLKGIQDPFFVCGAQYQPIGQYRYLILAAFRLPVFQGDDLVFKKQPIKAHLP